MTAASTRSPRHKRGVSPLQALTLGLAAARLTQLVVDDAITEPIRQGIQAKATAEIEDRHAWEMVDEAVNCHACTSVWAAGSVLTASRLGPVGRFLVSTLALSQAALAVKSVIERIDR